LTQSNGNEFVSGQFTKKKEATMKDKMTIGGFIAPSTKGRFLAMGLLLAGAFGRNAYGVNETWLGNVSDTSSNWSSVGNWSGSPVRVPTSADLAALNNTVASYTVNFGTNITTYTISSFILSNNGGNTTTLNINQGTLATGSASTMNILGSAGTINVNNTSVLKTAFGLNVSAGDLTLNGGSVFTNTSATSALTVTNGGLVSLQGGQLVTPKLSLFSTAVLDFGLTTPGANNAIKITGTGGLVLDGTVNVNDLGGFTTGTYLLMTYAGTLTDNGLNVGVLPAGFSATVDNSTAGQVNLDITAVPEPSTVLLSTGGVIGLWLMRGRRRTA
jgi:hypothetical protein